MKFSVETSQPEDWGKSKIYTQEAAQIADFDSERGKDSETDLVIQLVKQHNTHQRGYRTLGGHSHQVRQTLPPVPSSLPDCSQKL